MRNRTSTIRLGPLVRVTTAEPLEGYAVRITFEDTTTRVIDLEPYLVGPIFAPLLADPALFRQVEVRGGTVAWPNGADIDPDVLYYDLTPAWREATEEK